MSPFLLASMIAAALTAAAEPRVWTVGRGQTDFPLIAPAVAAAADGDEIRVRAGVYREDLVLHRRIRLTGDAGAILFGTGNGTVIDVLADDCEIRNLVIDGTGIGDDNEMDAAIRLLSNRNVVANNSMRRVFYGVVIAGGSDNLVTDNRIEGLLDLPFGKRGDGIYLYKAPRNRVVRNHVTGQRDGIYLQYAPGAIVTENVVEQSRYGFHDMFSDGTVIRDNAFRTSLVGANLMNSRNVVVERNSFERNRGVTAVGLSLKDCDASVISGNQFVANARGLQLDGSAENRFLGNRFLQNDTAIRLLASAERNTFAGNEFSQNWSDVVKSGSDETTIWSENGKGNLWSRYTGFDFDGDGVGESAHALLKPFEQIEASNELARLYLQSPAAGALDLAARSTAKRTAASVDAHPLVEGSESKSGLLWLAGVAVALAGLFAHKGVAR